MKEQEKIEKKNNDFVITNTGEKVPRNKCRKIKEVYYKMGVKNEKDSGECFELFNPNTEKTAWFRKNNPDVIWDYSKNEYCIKTNQILGLVDFNEKTGFVEGYFVPDIYTNIVFESKTAINENIIKKAGLAFESFTGRFLKPSEFNKKRFELGIVEQYDKINYKTLKEFYNSADHTFFNEMQKMYDHWKNKNFKESVFDKYFRNFTIGVEIETSGGNIPENKLYQLGLLPLRDGSIKGHEYTSVIIKDKQFDTFKNIFTETKENCSTNQNCSLHYHFGNIKKSKAFTVAFWMLYYRLQDSLEVLCPPYKRDLMYLTNKRVNSGGSGRNGVKDHCKKMPSLFNKSKITNIDEAFNIILMFLNEGSQPTCVSQRELLFKHIKDGRQKWDFENRYYAVNLIPFLFESKQTIEFRYHSGTVNFYKAFAWALICSALLQYAELNIEKILEGKEKIQLTDVINIFNDKTEEGIFITDWLNEYINYRSLLYQKMVINHDIFGKEFIEDNTFQLKFQGLCPLTFQ